MGKQVRFFMTHDDELEFLVAIRKIAPLKVILRYFESKAEMEVKLLRPVGSFKGDASLCLINTALVGELEVASYPGQLLHSIDLLRSEVVEFTRCAPFETWLNDGRLWFEERTTNDKKSRPFLLWANSLLKWIRSNYERDERGYFIGSHALELSRARKLQLGPPAEPQLSLEQRKRILGVK
jgi:hypothetical protein